MLTYMIVHSNILLLIVVGLCVLMYIGAHESILLYMIVYWNLLLYMTVPSPTPSCTGYGIHPREASIHLISLASPRWIEDSPKSPQGIFNLQSSNHRG